MSEEQKQCAAYLARRVAGKNRPAAQEDPAEKKAEGEDTAPAEGGSPT